jgi:hypothetical protein
VPVTVQDAKRSEEDVSCLVLWSEVVQMQGACSSERTIVIDDGLGGVEENAGRSSIDLGVALVTQMDKTA